MRSKFLIAAASAALLLPTSATFAAEQVPSKGTTPYVTHFVFRPLLSIDVSGVGTVATLEATGTTDNMKGEKMLDKMSAGRLALNVQSGEKKYIGGASVLADAYGDKIFSTFDTREVDKSQPDMKCGTHIITGGTGKYVGITGSEPFACNSLPALAGEGGYTSMNIPHNTSWEIKKAAAIGKPETKPVAKPQVKPNKSHATVAQPLTRADCKKAGMQWNSNANVCGGR